MHAITQLKKNHKPIYFTALQIAQHLAINFRICASLEASIHSAVSLSSG